MNSERQQAAIRFLERDYIWHVDMLEALRRGRGQVVYFEGSTVLVRRSEMPDFYLLTADSPEAGLAAFAGRSDPRCVVARGPGVPEMLRARFGLQLSDYCYKVFIAHGWKWGGDWNGDKDYQHFYKELSGVKR